MNKIKYRIEFLDEDNSKNTSMIYDYRIENKNVVIIEAETILTQPIIQKLFMIY